MRLSYWDQNKENFVKKALADYKDKDCPSAGFNILRYSQRGIITFKDGADITGLNGYETLRAAKADNLQYKEIENGN